MSDVPAYPDLTRLGGQLLHDFQLTVASLGDSWLDEECIPVIHYQELHYLAEELEQQWQAICDWWSLEGELTSGFIPAHLSSTGGNTVEAEPTSNALEKPWQTSFLPMTTPPARGLVSTASTSRVSVSNLPGTTSVQPVADSDAGLSRTPLPLPSRTTNPLDIPADPSSSAARQTAPTIFSTQTSGHGHEPATTTTADTRKTAHHSLARMELPIQATSSSRSTTSLTERKHSEQESAHSPAPTAMGKGKQTALPLHALPNKHSPNEPALVPVRTKVQSGVSAPSAYPITAPAESLSATGVTASPHAVNSTNSLAMPHAKPESHHQQVSVNAPHLAPSLPQPVDSHLMVNTQVSSRHRGSSDEVFQVDLPSVEAFEPLTQAPPSLPRQRGLKALAQRLQTNPFDLSAKVPTIAEPSLEMNVGNTALPSDSVPFVQTRTITKPDTASQTDNRALASTVKRVKHSGSAPVHLSSTQASLRKATSPIVNDQTLTTAIETWSASNRQTQQASATDWSTTNSHEQASVTDLWIIPDKQKRETITRDWAITGGHEQQTPAPPRTDKNGKKLLEHGQQPTKPVIKPLSRTGPS
jgi:hypothetical protein